MNSIIGRSGLAAAALCGIWLAGCDSVKDVRDEPHTALPTQRVVLDGKIYGLGIRRAIGLQNGAGQDIPFSNFTGVAGEPIDPVKGRVTPFSFGALLDGSSYDVRVREGLTPHGKVCEVHNGTGVLHYNESAPNKGSPQNIEVICKDDPAVSRRDIRVTFPESFRNAPGAKVTLLTEEGLFEEDPKFPTDGGPDHVWFRDKLITVPEAGVLPMEHIVKAYTEEGSTPALRLINRCAVTNHTRPSPVAGSVGDADVTNVAVGACKFSVGGNDSVAVNGINVASGGAVRYSLPVGVATAPAMGAGGVTLELRYPNGNPVPSATGPTTEVTITSFGSQFTFPTLVTSGAECPTAGPGEEVIPCEVRGFYEVVVKQHPAGQRCIVANSTAGTVGRLIGLGAVTDLPRPAANNAHNNHAGAANLYIRDESLATGRFPDVPANYTRLRVYCRNLPPPARQLTGTYQLINQATFTHATNAPIASAAWSPALTFRRFYSHMLTLLADGTFLFGAHSGADGVNTLEITNHAEQGFYDWDPTNAGGGTTAGPKLRFTIHVDGYVPAGTVPIELAGGLGQTEGPRTTGTGATALQHRVMDAVEIGTGFPRTLSGRFGPDGAPASTTRREVLFSEPLSVDGEMTGSWVTQDGLRFWSFQPLTTFGFHAGANGYTNLQHNCIKMDDFAQSSGQYVSSPGGTQTQCSPLGSAFNFVSSQGYSPTPALQFYLPGWRGPMPGLDIGGSSTVRSPSPVHFRIASPGTFESVADPVLFPPGSLGSTSWCATEILGIRPTLNGELKEDLKPIYFCRSRVN